LARIATGGAAGNVSLQQPPRARGWFTCLNEVRERSVEEFGIIEWNPYGN
jgi:hypothetical protein